MCATAPLPLLLATDMFSSKPLHLSLDDDTYWLGNRDMTCPLLLCAVAALRWLRLDLEIDKASALLKQITTKATTMAAPPVVLPIII